MLRLGAALAFSLALHLSVMYGVTVIPPRAVEERVVIQARVAPAEPGPSTSTPSPPRARQIQDRRPDDAPSADTPSSEDNPIAMTAAASPVDPATALPKVEMPLLADSTWYPAKQLDVYPQPLAPIRPRYPDAAARDNVAGSVTLLLMVDENGLVRDADVAQADPAGYFEEDALAAFREARFTPAARNGRPVRSRILVRVTFTPETRE
jgi:protein TonB